MEKGKYLMIIDNGLEGHAVKRYLTSAELSEAILDGENYGSRFILAEEMEMVIIGRRVDNEK